MIRTICDRPHKLSQNQLRERDSRNLWRGIFKGKLIDDTVDALNSKKSLSLWRILKGKQYPVAAHFITSPKPDNTDVDPQWTDELGTRGPWGTIQQPEWTTPSYTQQKMQLDL